MTPRLSKIVLTSHITVSVGWLGAVSVFLALAIVGLTIQDVQLARAAYLAMEVSAWYVIVPFCLASLLTGVVEALGTRWGLFKHYWVLVKLVLTVAATVALLLHLGPIGRVARVAMVPSFSLDVLPDVRMQLVADAGAALLLLLVITALSVYKPWGKIQAGQQGAAKQARVLRLREVLLTLSWQFYALLGIIVLVVAIILRHVLGGGMRPH